jgi:hAT family C-terminal dimerisation region
MMQYRNMTDKEDLDAENAIMESLERRWAVADQQIFISSVILNPFYQGRPFTRLYFLNNAGIHSLLGHLWSHFFKTEPSQDFHTELTEYLTHTGRYANLASHCARAGHEAHTMVHCLFTSSTSIYAQLIVFQGEHLDPISIYIDFSFSGQPPTPFIRLARWILSICMNSATCERLWSVFGNTLTKLRNRLGIETLTSLSELKMHIRDEHVQKETKKQMKRMFVTCLEAANTANKTQQPLPPPVNELSTSGNPDIDENFDPTT